MSYFELWDQKMLQALSDRIKYPIGLFETDLVQLNTKKA